MRPLKVVLTADPEIPVPPTHYGGIERIVDMLARGLLARGHDVSLLAGPGSTCPVRFEAWRGSTSGGLRPTISNALQLRAWTRRVRPDILHNFARLAYALPSLGAAGTVIQSYQRQITPSSVRWGHRLSRGRMAFSACSRYCRDTAGFPGARWSVIANGVPLDRYPFSPAVPADAPLVFLGRLERIKGAHAAIEAAALAGRRLILAGNRAERGDEAEYFRREIEPRCDGDRVKYVGPVDDAGKAGLLGCAAALLFPIEWDEPFGIVMAEALACGTPVIAFGRGAVPEVVIDGRTGFVCRTVEEMAAAAGRLQTIDRRLCRADCEERFSDGVIVGQYERLYESLAGRPA
ncbi:MAG TPA: glycosyltransferase [Candidatus Eisenbacteria bacterium]|nr:glycosyltransferase [Candidatus Eisenbacteria bacterium]